MTRQQFIEVAPADNVQLIEAQEENQPLRLRVVDAVVADQINGNGRRYPESVLRAAYGHLMAAGGMHVEGGVIAGQAEHPSGPANWLENVIIWESAELGPAERNPDWLAIHLEGRFINTANGREAADTVREGIRPGVSLRGWGKSKTVTENGQQVEEVTALTFEAFDLVGNPSYRNLAAVLEGIFNGGYTMPQENTQATTAAPPATTGEQGQQLPLIDEAEVIARYEAERAAQREAVLAEHEAQQERINQAISERDAQMRADLGLDDTATDADLAEAIRANNQRLAELAEAERVRAITDAVAAAVREVTESYGEFAQQFSDSVQAAVQTAETLEEAAAIIEAKRKEYDAIVARSRALQEGLRATLRNGGVIVDGPVIEQYGIPQYAAGSVQIIEHLRAANRNLRVFNPTQGMQNDLSAQYTAKYLEAFDKKYSHALAQETKRLEEANSTADLSLPYTVARAIIFEAYPQLVGAQIFDYGVAPGSPVKVHYEKWEQDTQLYVSVTDEDLAVAAHSTPVAMANQWIVPGSDTGNVILDPIGTAVPLTYGIDYVINYEAGTFTMLENSPNVGGLPGTVRVSYTYDKINNPECDVIEQGKLKILQDELVISAMRLAAEICFEAVTFSRANLGYDLVQRNLAHLVRVIREKIDQANMYAALAAAVALPGNWPGGTPPTWDSSSGTVEDLITQIGLARVQVIERNYTPEWILTSPMIAEVLSNWTLFRDNAQVSLGPNGLAGNVKGLPVYWTNLFPQNDNFLLVGTRDSVTHRVLDPMQIRGPHPVLKPVESTPGSGEYDTNRISDAEFYYARETNGRMVPVPEKLAFVQVT